MGSQSRHSVGSQLNICVIRGYSCSRWAKLAQRTISIETTSPNRQQYESEMEQLHIAAFATAPQMHYGPREARHACDSNVGRIAVPACYHTHDQCGRRTG